jgi:two-component system response regulator DegU
VLVVDDQELFREIARSMFAATEEFRVIAEASDGFDALDAYRKMTPQLVLMDVQMARMNGLDATREILKTDPDASVILISMRPDPEYRRIAGELGAVGFIAKRDLAPEALREMLSAAAQRAA